jgi:DNA ligase D-like protein (predicted ligase)
MKSSFEKLPAEARKKLKETDMPDWYDPMLATLIDDPFSDPGWIYERKLDGERCIIYREGEGVRLMSRNQKRINDTYPELEAAFLSISADRFIIDGEIVAFEGDVTSFERLQRRMQIEDRAEARRRAEEVAVCFYAFDLLYLSGFDVTDVPLRHRKALLKRALSYDDPIRYTQHRNQQGEAYLQEACERGWEGLIAKDAGSAYVHSRSRKWLKFKCITRQEFVIGGYTDPHGERIGFGALMVGYYEGDDLIYAGKVGTGYDDETLKRLKERFEAISCNEMPFSGRKDISDDEAHWVQPELVAEVGFTEWTQHGKLRHPRYLGLRRDKEPQDVIREEPV